MKSKAFEKNSIFSQLPTQAPDYDQCSMAFMQRHNYITTVNSNWTETRACYKKAFRFQYSIRLLDFNILT
jgi:hypothetical protein